MDLDINEPREVQENQEGLARYHEGNDPDEGEFAFDWRATRKMRKGQDKIKRQFSLSIQTDNIFRDFLEIYTGTTPIRGKGLASFFVDFFIRLGVGIVTEFKLEKLAVDIREIAVSDKVLEMITENLRKLADMLE
jgi:hypothetical protein